MTIAGQRPEDEDIEWLKYGRELFKDSPRVLDETAKSLITLGSSFLTIYTGSFVLFKFNENIYQDPLNWILISLTVICWLLSISLNAYVFFPDCQKISMDSPTDIRNSAKNINENKLKRLKIGASLFVISLLLSSFSIIWFGSGKISANDIGANNKTVQFVIGTENIPIFHNMSISFEKGTLRTIKLRLLNKVNESDLVETPNGEIVEFKKDLTEGIIYFNSSQS
jgi:hypothetical protein